MSEKPNYGLVQILLDSLQRDLQWFINPPDGTKQHPATTCLELWLAHPNSTNGETEIHVCSEESQGSDLKGKI